MRFLLRGLDRTEDAVMVAGVAAATILVVTQVVLRYVFNMSIHWAEEAVRFIIVWVALIGAGMGVREGKHISVDLLQAFLPERFARLLAFLGVAIGCAFALILFWTGWTLVQHALNTGQVSSAMRLPIGWVYMILPISAVFIFIRFVQLGHALWTGQQSARIDIDRLAREAGVETR